jgi:hypothetical protein
MKALQQLQQLLSKNYTFECNIDEELNQLKYFSTMSDSEEDGFIITVGKNNQLKIKECGKAITLSRFVKNKNLFYVEIEDAFKTNDFRELKELLTKGVKYNCINMKDYTLKQLADNTIKIIRTKEGEEVEIKKDDFLDSIFSIAEQVADFKKCFKKDVFNVQYEDLIEGYDNTPFYSCMQKRGIYFKELEQFGKLANFFNNGDLIGRAILWNIDAVDFENNELQGLQFLDRIYTKENHDNTALILDWADKNNIITKAKQTYTDLTTFRLKGKIIKSEATLNIKDDVTKWLNCPFMDTFRYFEVNKLSNTLDKWTTHALDSTGGYYNDVTCCECCNRVIPSDEIDYYSEFSSGVICFDCVDGGRYVYAEDLEDYIPRNHAVWVEDKKHFVYDNSNLYYAEDTQKYYEDIDYLIYTEDTYCFFKSDENLFYTEDTGHYFEYDDELYKDEETQKYYEFSDNMPTKE